MNILLWGVIPYITLFLVIGGTMWRYRFDKFGWTTRSSELYESRLLRIASPLFHYGVLVVIAGHAIGLVIPESWTEFFGITESLYHWTAAISGLIAAAATLVGCGLLIYRRRRTGPVFMATTRNDKLMYAALVSALLAGTFITLVGTVDPHGEGVNYRETVSPWFRSIFLLNPQPELMAESLPSFQIHAVAGMLLFIIWPFTRLVHAFSAPFGYLFRPYVVYRDRGPHDAGSHAPKRGWEKVG